MKTTHTKVAILFSYLCCITTSLYAVVGRSYFSPRSQGLNTARQMVGMEPYPPCKHTEHTCIWTAATPAYSQSISHEKLQDYLFFNNSGSMTFGNLDDPKTDVFARNFLLNDDFKGSVSIKPDIQNFVLDIQAHINLDEWTCGLYLDAHFPITWSDWDLHLEERTTSTGTAVPANKLGNDEATASFLKQVTRAWVGDTVNVNVFPDVMQQMNFATVDGKRTEVALADLHLSLGYQVICKPDWKVDLQLHVVAPAGKRPEAHFFFEPQVGNSKHAGLGAGVHGYHEVFDYGDTALTAVFDIRGYYLFNSTQRRTFDLKKNGKGSRYLLFKKFKSDGTFSDELLFGPNVTTRKSSVKIGPQIEATMMATYYWCTWQLNAGAGAWLRAKESITIKDGVPSNTFGIQGNTDTTNAQTASGTRVDGTNANIFDATTVFLKTEDFDTKSAAAPIAVSYKGFAHASRFWYDNPYQPFLGFGAELELSAFSNKALEQISVWLKAGFSFT